MYVDSCTNRFVVDVVVMNVDHFVYGVFALERDKSEPCNIYKTSLCIP